MSGALCGKCMKTTNDYTEPSCDEAGCPGKRPNFLAHILRKDTCDHDFKGYREFADGRGGESVCTKCGMGAMAHTLRTGL